jgi:hypothetical protein
MWMGMTTCIRKVASEEFGVTKGGKCEAKETWWWNEKVEKAIKEKKECFRRMHLDRSKWLFKLINEDSLWHKILKKKYVKNSTIAQV